MSAPPLRSGDGRDRAEAVQYVRTFRTNGVMRPVRIARRPARAGRATQALRLRELGDSATA